MRQLMAPQIKLQTSARRAFGNQLGMTMIEMLLATMILATLILAVSETLQSSFKMKDGLSQNARTNHRIRSAMNKVIADLQHAYIVSTKDQIKFSVDRNSKGVFIIDWILTTVCLLGTRGSFRIFTETMKRKTLAGDQVVIYGAGRGGELLLREILNNKALNINPVGFLDDDPLKSGKKIQGFPILGNFDKLSELKHKHAIRGVLLSFNDVSNAKACQAAAAYCRRNGLFLKKFSIRLEPVNLIEMT